MARRVHVLFYLEEERRFRLSFDELQWIVERGNPKSYRPGKDGGYRGFRFICTEKHYLLRDLRECRVPVCPAGRLLVDALPSSFPEFHQWRRALGIERMRGWLISRAIALRDYRRVQGLSTSHARYRAWSADAPRPRAANRGARPMARKRGGRFDAGG